MTRGRWSNRSAVLAAQEEETRNHNRSVILRTVPKELEALTALALDLRWTWSHSSDRLWERLDQDI
ncbi:DUF3417 domain-containing protein [Nitrospira sp. Nam74]